MSTTTDFPCCEASAADMDAALAARESERIARWIAPTLRDQYPGGPYAVHAYYPATGREITMRNQTGRVRGTAGGAFEASGKCRDVHVDARHLRLAGLRGGRDSRSWPLPCRN